MAHDTDIIERLKRENDALKRELAVLRTLSFEDPLTGLKNRRYFDERLATELDRAERHDEPVSVVMIDVDDFKGVNDSYGHQVGDQLLRWVAGFLDNNVREHDVVCRTGGDEFAIILPSADETGYRLLISRLRAALSRTRPLIGDHRLRLSLGGAAWHGRYADRRAFLADADMAMYRDKLHRKATQAPAAAAATWS